MKRPLDGRIKDNFLTNERLVLNFSRLLSVSMVYCLGYGLQKIIEQIFVDWNLDYLPWLAGVIAIEAIISSGQLHRARNLELSAAIYRLVEWVVILTMLRAFFYTRQGWSQLLDDFRTIGPELLYQVFNPEFIMTALALLLIWLLTTWTMDDLYEIESSMFLLESAGFESYFSDSTAIRGKIIQRLFGVGLPLVIASGLAEANWASLFSGEYYAPPTENWYVLVYFILLLLLLGQTYFATLRAGWAWERIQIDGRIAKVWLGYCILALLLIGIFVRFLPTRYSLNYLESLQYILNLIISIVLSIFLYIAMLGAYLMAWIFSFFGGNEPSDELPEIVEVAPPEPFQDPLQIATGTEIIQSIAFWVFLTLLIIFAFYQYTRQNRALISKLKLLNPWKGLRSLLAWAGWWSRGARKQAGEVIQKSLQRLRAVRIAKLSPQSFNYVNPNRMPPRQRILFFYHAMLRRAEEAGIPRQNSQTPNEFELTLKSYLEQLEQPADPASLAELTRSFQEARYSRHEITHSQANRVHTAWGQLRQFFRNK